MSRFAEPSGIVDQDCYNHAVERCRLTGVRMPTFAQLAEPTSIAHQVIAELDGVDSDSADPRNLFRVHWFNRRSRLGLAHVPEHVLLTKELTGVDAPILVALGDRFPMIGAHKVLAAYACLAPRLVTGQFDPTRQRAVWPSTGNYARGGVAISAMLGCRGVAVLPENMSRERFAWLERWVERPEDIIRTRGSESNVKEIYDACALLEADPANVIFNQFSAMPNHLVHHSVTGKALESLFESVAASQPGLRLAAFVSASGSAGTLGAGDYLKDRFGSLTVAAEALECPTLLRNGYGEHRIQGIGDKHVPLIHNVMQTDVVAAVSDKSTDALDLVFNSPAGRLVLARHHVAEETIDALGSFGLSSICNLLAAIKLAKLAHLGEGDVIVTVATDGAAMYQSERPYNQERLCPHGLDERAATELYATHMLGAGADDIAELTLADRQRIFNLGYFTWVEQQGVTLEDFEARRQQSFWRGLRPLLDRWDDLIVEFNQRCAA